MHPKVFQNKCQQVATYVSTYIIHMHVKTMLMLVKFIGWWISSFCKNWKWMKIMDQQIKLPLLSNSSEYEGTRNETKRKIYNYWQRRKDAWTRKRQASNSCRLGFNCIILIWSIFALITTVLSYFRLVQLLKNGHDKLR